MRHSGNGRCSAFVVERSAMRNSLKLLCTLFAGCASEAPTSQQVPPLARDTIELEDTKLIIEHNATDEDTGFQGFVDGEPWNKLEIRDPTGKLAVSVAAKGPLDTLGLTELFFETGEPANAEV